MPSLVCSACPVFMWRNELKANPASNYVSTMTNTCARPQSQGPPGGCISRRLGVGALALLSQCCAMLLFSALHRGISQHLGDALSYFTDDIKELEELSTVSREKKKHWKKYQIVWRTSHFCLPGKPCHGLPPFLVHTASLHRYIGQWQAYSCIGIATWQRAMNPMTYLKIPSASLTWLTSKISSN